MHEFQTKPVYVSTRGKFLICSLAACVWLLLSLWISQVWFRELATLTGEVAAAIVIATVAIIPGFMNAFLATGLMLDRRPPSRDLVTWPRLTVLVPAYNEAEHIVSTLQSIAQQDYPATVRVLVIDDGSQDGTARVAENWAQSHDSDFASPITFEVLRLTRNIGKAAALNAGLASVRTELLVSVDADCWLHRNALRRLIGRFRSDPPGTVAVAGAVLIRNSRQSMITRAQEWDYFLGIGAVKRVQSLFQGVLVAQGAFSAYDRDALNAVGGWPDTVGEDIVMSWKLLAAGWRIGHAEDAFAFTNGPATLAQFVRQRRRWSRGMIEAFKETPRILSVPRLSLMFVSWNAVFPLLDLGYTLFFIPGVVAALFGHYWIAGPMTFAVLPSAMAVNYLMIRTARRAFESSQLTIRTNTLGLMIYGLFYGLILQPACLWGYVSELLQLPKNWGTKWSESKTPTR